MSVFCFIDEIIELKKNQSLTAFYTLKGNEEFLKDHFSGFPVMPGVLLLESLKQACSRLLSENDGGSHRFVSAEDVKFGQFVKPGGILKIQSRLLREENNFYFFDGRIDLMANVNGTPQGRALTAAVTLELLRG